LYIACFAAGLQKKIPMFWMQDGKNYVHTLCKTIHLQVLIVKVGFTFFFILKQAVSEKTIVKNEESGSDLKIIRHCKHVVLHLIYTIFSTKDGFVRNVDGFMVWLGTG
jgi:hypothetical protein